jgi:rhodanese-related sulfurtransferase
MNPSPWTATSQRSREPWRTVMEASAVAGMGLALALLANQLSPRGLSLGRNYFPAAPATAAAAAPAAATPTNAAAASLPSSAAPSATAHQDVRARIEARGFRLLESAEVRQLHSDPRREQELVVFVDARSDAHYLEGHIVGAYQFDHYYPATHLPVVLPVCQQAELVVVYCSGGDCEDSEFAAVALKEAGIPAGRLAVYGGGMADWVANRQPVEVGPHGSGQVKEGQP